MDSQNLALATRDLPFLKYRVRDVVQPDHDGPISSSEALKLLGLDYKVEQRKLAVISPEGYRGKTVPDMFANVRTDTGDILGIVGGRFALAQNDVVANIGNAVCDTGEALVDSGWSLRNGARMGLTLRIPSADVAVPGDANGHLQMYLMVENSHDGNSSVTGHLGPVRPACTNMVRLMKKSAIASFKIRHTSGSVERMTTIAREALGITFRYSEFLAGEVDRYLNMTVAERDVDEILRAAFPVTEGTPEGRLGTTVYAGILRNWQESDTIPQIRETAWGLLNAGNEYLEHLVPVRSRTFDEDSVRGVSILTGTAMQGTNRLAEAIARHR